MTGEGTVIRVSENRAVVKISKSSACGHDCASCTACQNPSYEMTVLNPIGAKAGDRVVIESDTLSVLTLSFFLYIFPVFLLIISAALCEKYSLGAVSVAVFIGFGAVWFFLIKQVNKKTKIKNTIVKISDAPALKD